jgi:S-adenosylmethionine hydrolase
MKTNCFLFICLFLNLFTCSLTDAIALENPIHSTINDVRSFALETTHLYNQNLAAQQTIKKINQQRPKIFIYTDFGGGKNEGKPLIDLQTSGEIASAGWKATLQQTLYINDSAPPLSPFQAALNLAKTFPYQIRPWESFTFQSIRIQTIVVHVIDPGVGNGDEGHNPQPRALVLRKDGVLFIGPDNGTLTWACPNGSLAGIWEIDTERLNTLSGIDVKAGGTFHGRDIFSEAAFRLAAGEVALEEIGTPYSTQALKNRLSPTELPLNAIQHGSKPIEFATLNNERFVLEEGENDNLSSGALFERAYLLGVVQSSLYAKEKPLALTSSKKIFIANSPVFASCIAIVNFKTGNIFIGPNNGLGTSFFKNYSKDDCAVFSLSQQVVEVIRNEQNNEIAYALITQQPLFNNTVEEIKLFGDDSVLIRDSDGRPKEIQALIWIDVYGNIKTTLESTILDEVRNRHADVDVVINGVTRSVIFAETFSEVAEDQLFIYNGSTAVIGSNPHRSKRYVELTSNGVFGKFGTDYFRNKEKDPQSGQSAVFYFKY